MSVGPPEVCSRVRAIARGTAPRRAFVERRLDRTAIEELVTRLNAAIARVNAETPTDRRHPRPLALADEVARYDEACRRWRSTSTRGPAIIRVEFLHPQGSAIRWRSSA